MEPRPPESASRVYGLHLGDLNRSSNQSHGIINYAVGLAVELSKVLDPSERLIVYANPEIAGELRELQLDLSRIHLLPQPKNYFHRLVLDSRVVWLARRHGVSVLHFPKGILPLVLPPSAPTLISTIHDDIPMQYADARFTRAGFRAQLRAKVIAALFMRSLRRSDCVITVSGGSRRALLARLRAGKRGASKRQTDIDVVGATSPLPELDFVPTAQRPRRVLHLASPLAHKNTAFVVGSMLRYLDERSADLELVLQGRLPADLVVDDPRIEHRAEPVTNAEMAHLMATARALLFVSSTEGYGLPPVEAWMYGTPSIYDSAPALEELEREVPARVTALSYEAFADALDTVLALDDAELLEIRETVTSASDPKAASARVLEIYREHAAG